MKCSTCGMLKITQSREVAMRYGIEDADTSFEYHIEFDELEEAEQFAVEASIADCVVMVTDTELDNCVVAIGYGSKLYRPVDSEVV